MEKAEIRQMINGPESFTPDAHAILGEAPEVSAAVWNLKMFLIVLCVCVYM